MVAALSKLHYIERKGNEEIHSPRPGNYLLTTAISYLDYMYMFWSFFRTLKESLKVSSNKTLGVCLLDSQKFPRMMTIEEMKSRKKVSNRVSVLTPATVNFFEGS